MKILIMALVLPLGMLGACGQSRGGTDEMTALAYVQPDKEKPEPPQGSDPGDKSDEHVQHDGSDKGEHAKPPLFDPPEGDGASPVDNDVIVPKGSQPKPKGSPCCAG